MSKKKLPPLETLLAQLAELARETAPEAATTPDEAYVNILKHFGPEMAAKKETFVMLCLDGYSLCTGPGCRLCALVNSIYRKQEVVPQVTNDFEVVAQPTSEDVSGRSASAPVPTCDICGKPWADHIGPCKQQPLRRMTHKEVDAFMEGEAVLIPVKILKEWRRGLMTMDTAHPLGQAHANEIIQEIEGYLQ